MSDEDLVPQVRESIEATLAIKQQARDLCAGLSDEQANWRPAPEKWSIAQCLEHVNTGDGLYFQHLEAAIKKGEDRNLRSQGPFRYSRVGSWFERTLEPPVTPKKRKFKAPPMFSPESKTISLREALEQLEKNQDRLAELLRRSSGLDLRRIKVRSPATAMLRFNLGQAFRVLGAHCRRHVCLAALVRAHDGFPSA